MSKHTPGPWTRDPEDNTIRSKDGTIVCSDGTGAFIAIPSDDDARLIAAAPEMYATLKDLVATHDAVDPEGLFAGLEIIKAKAVLAKIDGAPK